MPKGQCIIEQERALPIYQKSPQIQFTSITVKRRNTERTVHWQVGFLKVHFNSFNSLNPFNPNFCYFFTTWSETFTAFVVQLFFLSLCPNGKWSKFVRKKLCAKGQTFNFKIVGGKNYVLQIFNIS